MPTNQLTKRLTTLPITRTNTPAGGAPSTRSALPGRWESALIAAASSLATVAFAFGAPVHPRSFGRHLEIRDGS